MFGIIRFQGNTNLNFSEISFQTYQNEKFKNNDNTKCWRKGITHTLPVGIKYDTTTVEDSLANFQKTKWVTTT